MECDFTLKHYEEILRLAEENGYKIMRMRDAAQSNLTGKVIVIRHDVDFNFGNPFRIGELEHKLGVSSTFFVRMHATSYNTLSYRNLEALGKLASMGHEIGIHFENRVFKDGSRIKTIRLFKEILEECAGVKISGIAPHDTNRGSKKHEALSKEELKECGLLYDAQSDTFMGDMKYISDSAGRWREGCACNFIKDGTPRICMLTHPIWWFEKTPAENY